MTTKLAWFPMYVDDWCGGTTSMLQAELGAYLQALLAQWHSGDLQAIPDDPARLLAICRGPFSDSVREKFTSIKIKGINYLRNDKLKAIYEKQKTSHESRVSRASKAAQARYQAGAQASPQALPQADRTQNPDSSLNTKKKERAAEPRTHDPLLDAEPIKLWRQKVSLTPPPGICRERMATEVTDLERWGKTLDKWLLAGNKKNNIEGQLDWYKTGIPEYARNGKPKSNKVELPGDGPGWE